MPGTTALTFGHPDQRTSREKRTERRQLAKALTGIVWVPITLFDGTPNLAARGAK